MAVERETTSAEMVRVEFTIHGPRLYIGAVRVREWNGSIHADAARELADQIREELAHAR